MNKLKKPIVLGVIILLFLVLCIALKPGKRKAITPDDFIDTMKSLGYRDYNRATNKNYDQYYYEIGGNDELVCGLMVFKDKAYQDNFIDELKNDFKNEKKTNPDFVKWTEQGNMLRYEKKTSLRPFIQQEFYIFIDNTLLAVMVQDNHNIRYVYDILRALGYYSYEKGFE